MIKIEQGKLKFLSNNTGVNPIELGLSDVNPTFSGLIVEQIKKIIESYRIRTLYVLYYPRLKLYYIKRKGSSDSIDKATLFSRRTHAKYYLNILEAGGEKGWQIDEYYVLDNKVLS